MYSCGVLVMILQKAEVRLGMYTGSGMYSPKILTRGAPYKRSCLIFGI